MGLFSIFKSKDQTKNTFHLPYFGTINLNSPKDSDTIIPYRQDKIEIDINFAKDRISQNSLLKLNELLNKLDEYIPGIFNVISKDFDDEGVTHEYLKHHKEEGILQLDDSTNLRSGLDKLKLIKIGCYPDNKDCYVWFDYSLGEDTTDYIISIKLNQGLKVKFIDFES